MDVGEFTAVVQEKNTEIQTATIELLFLLSLQVVSPETRDVVNRIHGLMAERRDFVLDTWRAVVS